MPVSMMISTLTRPKPAPDPERLSSATRLWQNQVMTLFSSSVLDVEHEPLLVCERRLFVTYNNSRHLTIRQSGIADLGTAGAEP